MRKRSVKINPGVGRFGIHDQYRNFQKMKDAAQHVSNIDQMYHVINDMLTIKAFPDSVKDFMGKVLARLENEERACDKIVGECWQKEKKSNARRNKRLCKH